MRVDDPAGPEIAPAFGHETPTGFCPQLIAQAEPQGRRQALERFLCEYSLSDIRVSPMTPFFSTILNWRPNTPFYYGWLVLGLSGMGAFVATAIAGVVLGGVQTYILEDTNWSRTSIGLAASCGVWASGFFAPFAGRLADRYGPRWLMPIGVLVLGLSMVAIGGVHAAWQFFLAAVIGRVISQPFLIGVVPRTMAVNFFNRRRNIALALTGIFRPISGALIIQAFSAIAVFADWRTAFRYLGFFSLALAIPMAILMRRRPEDIGLLPDGAPPNPSATGASAADGGPGPAGQAAPPGTAAGVSWTAREALRTQAFWLMAVVTFVKVTATSGLGFNLVPHLREFAGLTTPQAAGVLSVSTFLALSSLVWGQVAGRLTAKWCIVAALALSAVAALALLRVDSLWGAYVFGVLWGLFHSGLEVLMYILLADYFGRNSYGAIAGSLRPFEAGGLGLGQIVGPLIYDLTGSYTLLILFSSVLLACSSALMLLTRRPVKFETTAEPAPWGAPDRRA